MKKHTFVINSSVLIKNPEGKLLLIRRSQDEDQNPGKLGIPGGKLDAEDGCLIKGLCREIQEEIGITIEDVSLFETHMALKTEYNKLYLVFTAVTKGQPQALMDTDEILWVSQDELSSMPEQEFTPNTYSLATLSFKHRNLFQ